MMFYDIFFNRDIELINGVVPEITTDIYSAEFYSKPQKKSIYYTILSYIIIKDIDVHEFQQFNIVNYF